MDLDAGSATSDVNWIGKDTGMGTTEDLHIRIDPVDAGLADHGGALLLRRLMVKGSISDDADLRRMGNGNREFCGVMEDKCIAHRGTSPLLCQKHGESGR